MCNFNINITIHTPELADAIAKLADALASHPAPHAVASAPVSPAVSTVNLPNPAQKPPVSPAPVAPSAPAAPAPQPVQPAPTSAPASYAFAQLQQAAGVLVRAGRQQELRDLLQQKYHVQALTQLTETQYGTFATDLRALGVNI